MDSQRSYDYYLARFISRHGLEKHSNQLRRGIALVRSGGDRTEALRLLQAALKGLSSSPSRTQELARFAEQHALEPAKLADAYTVYEKTARAYLEALSK